MFKLLFYNYDNKSIKKIGQYGENKIVSVIILFMLVWKTIKVEISLENGLPLNSLIIGDMTRNS